MQIVVLRFLFVKSNVSNRLGGKISLQNKKISIAIPASVVSDTPHLREKTSKIGLIGRTAAIFRVNEIIIYPDVPKINQRVESDLVATLLAYVETPQYLRKRLFRLRPELQYAGILPPLRTPHHPLNRNMKKLKVGEYREGVVLSKTREGTLVDIGVEQPALLPDSQLPAGRRITVKIVRAGRQIEVVLVNRNEITEYWGYTVDLEELKLGKILKNRSFDLTIATSKYGAPFADIAEKMAGKWKEAKTVLVVFGAPSRGLYEIAKYEGLNLDSIVDFVVNTIPAQGTETVRTEEAIMASLAILNVQFCF
jgi:predicted SPOUT superfamily RNA methylase MTH1